VLALAALQIAVLTMTPGSDLFARFGHTAILVEDGDDQRVYNFGAFHGSDPALPRQFLHNRIPYFLGVSDFETFLGKYAARTIVGQVLALDEREARRLADLLAWTALPENREYKYDWFRNNCTTRTRDVVDAAIGGELRAQLTGRKAGRTIRGTLRDALWSVPSVFTAFSLALNQRVDGALTRWDELDMPADLMFGLREGLRADGRPLVASEWRIEGPLPRPRVQARFIQPLAEAVLLALLALGLLWPGRAARIAGGMGVAAWGLASGLVGLYLVAWWVLPYPDADASANLIAFSPLALVLVGSGIAHARGREARVGRRVVDLVLLATLVEAAAHLVGRGHQDHLRHAAYAVAALVLARAVLRRWAEVKKP
jgi:hypothetical protein